MDVLLFFIGTVLIVGAATWCITFAILTHHWREMDNNRIREGEVQRMYLLSDKALDMGKLPPGLLHRGDD